MKQLKSISIAAIVFVLLSFVKVEDNTKYMIGKWEMIKMITPNKKEMDVRQVLGASYMTFNADFTYEESGSSTTKGTWQIADKDYLQTKKDGQANFSEKMKIKQVSADEAHLETPNKTVMVLKRDK